MKNLNRDEVLFQVKRLYALYELTLSELNSEEQNTEANYAFTRLLTKLEEEYNSPLSDYIFEEGDTIECCTEKILNPPEYSEKEYFDDELFDDYDVENISFKSLIVTNLKWLVKRVMKLFGRR